MYGSDDKWSNASSSHSFASHWGAFLAQIIQTQHAGESSVSCKIFALTTNSVLNLLLHYCQLVLRALGVLAIDRTNWMSGSKIINILTLAIVCDGIAVPLFIKLLDSKGNSDTDERKDLLQEFIDTFGKDKIAYMLGDREFIGNDWLEWLHSQGIGFCIRIKKNMQLKHSNGGTMSAQNWFEKHGFKENYRTFIEDIPVQLSGKALPNGELLAVVSSANVAQPLQCYKRRWTIFAGH